MGLLRVGYDLVTEKQQQNKLVQPHIGILLIDKNEWTINLSNSTDES